MNSLEFKKIKSGHYEIWNNEQPHRPILLGQVSRYRDGTWTAYPEVSIPLHTSCVKVHLPNRETAAMHCFNVWKDSL